METNAKREQFEAYWSRQLWAECFQDVKDQMFAVWQASRADQVVTLPPLPAMPEPDEYATDDSHMDAYNAAKRMRDACARAIEAAGGRVVP